LAERFSLALLRVGSVAALLGNSRDAVCFGDSARSASAPAFLAVVLFDGSAEFCNNAAPRALPALRACAENAGTFSGMFHTF
jgi:hypothetical protein